METPAAPLIDVRSRIESFIDPHAPKGQTLAEALLPHSSLPATVGLVAAGVAVMALGAVLRLPAWGFSPLHLLAVLFVGAALGSRLGAIAAVVYLVSGILLPVLPGAHRLLEVIGGVSYAQLALGYLLGLIAAAFVAGWLAERRSWDRSFKMAGLLAAVGTLVAFVPGFLWLSIYLFVERSSRGIFDFDILPSIPIMVLTVVVLTAGLPYAWKWVESQRARRVAVPAST
jgi:biotin transport system substrate-specific component